MTPEELRKTALETHKNNADTKKTSILGDVKSYANRGLFSYNCELRPEYNSHSGHTNITEVR
jgi:hypothetical protein